ncbi:MAG: transposase, partial [Desulfobacteraceae bacterium]|nr:transposase [Desulfobacteraceae bacterium]
MPRSFRIDAPGALHHIIVRGIGRRKIFDDNADRDIFLDRLGTVISESGTLCYAWALIPNHFHLLLRTGNKPITTVMRRLLTGYAMNYNRRHKRSGHLFQNRYKSILCQKDPYFLELVRYIHLNPLRAKLVSDLRRLGGYPYAGHAVLMGKSSNKWQSMDDVLARFGKRLSHSRKKYREFIEKALNMGRRPELTGGGLVRSIGGWTAVKALRKAKVLMNGDERILGDSDFVEAVLKQNEQDYERRNRLKLKSVDLDTIAHRVSQVLNMPIDQVWSKGKYRHIVAARSLLCYWAVRELGMSATSLAPKFD